MDQNFAKISIDGWEIFDIPKKYDSSDYDDVREEVRNKLKDLPGLKAILEWGRASHPGISDIDFFVVFDHDSPSMCIPPNIAFSEKTRYLMKHKFLVITDKHLEDLLYMAPWITYNSPEKIPAIHGDESVNFKKLNLNPAEDEILNLAFLYEQNEQIVDLPVYLLQKKLPLRHILVQLKLARRIVEQTNLRCQKKIETDFLERFDRLIADWFEKDFKTVLPEILDLTREAARIAFTAPFCFAEEIEDKATLKVLKNSPKNLLKQFPPKNIFFTSFNYHKIFSDKIDSPKDALAASTKLYRDLRLPLRQEDLPFWLTVQPYLAATNLTAYYYFLDRGLLAERFKKDIFFTSSQIPILDYPVIEKRTKLIADLVEHYIPREGQGTQGKGVLFGGSFFGYLYRGGTLKRKLLTYYLTRQYFQRLAAFFKLITFKQSRN